MPITRASPNAAARVENKTARPAIGMVRSIPIYQSRNRKRPKPASRNAGHCKRSRYGVACSRASSPGDATPSTGMPFIRSKLTIAEVVCAPCTPSAGPPM